MMRYLFSITFCCLGIVACQDDAGEIRAAGTVPVEKTSKKIGVRNFQELNLTMSALTGIDHRAKPISNVYQTVNSMLPLDNSAQGFHAPVQVAVFRLASAYCHQLINLGKGRAELFPEIDFDAAATITLAPDKRNQVASTFVTALWERSAAMQLPASESTAKISQYISEALGEPSAVPESERYIAKDIEPMQQTKEVLFTVCSAMLASAPVTFH